MSKSPFKRVNYWLIHYTIVQYEHKENPFIYRVYLLFRSLFIDDCEDKLYNITKELFMRLALSPL